jgi:hypothetical protein
MKLFSKFKTFSFLKVFSKIIFLFIILPALEWFKIRSYKIDTLYLESVNITQSSLQLTSSIFPSSNLTKAI